ncbi:hypothetical protein HYV49_05130 [Candidatus Pacearchaeota archaeon]|nr:hypothetical protein [Candidatus Pacearchaeota archaeon]
MTNVVFKKKAIASLEKLAKRCDKKAMDPQYEIGNLNTIKMYCDDARDYRLVVSFIKCENYKKAAKIIHGMDTAVYEVIPGYIYNFLDNYM